MPLFQTVSGASRHWALGLAGFGLLALGGVAGGVAGHALHPPISMAPIHRVAIRDLASSEGIVTVRGRVAEAYGNRLVIDDGTARSLLDLGPRGDMGSRLPVGAVLTVQGRFDDAAFHPDFVVDPSGTVIAVGPRGGPRGGHHDHPGPDGPTPDRAPPAPGAQGAPVADD